MQCSKAELCVTVLRKLQEDGAELNSDCYQRCESQPCLAQNQVVKHYERFKYLNLHFRSWKYQM